MSCRARACGTRPGPPFYAKMTFGLAVPCSEVHTAEQPKRTDPPGRSITWSGSRNGYAARVIPGGPWGDISREGGRGPRLHPQRCNCLWIHLCIYANTSLNDNSCRKHTCTWSSQPHLRYAINLRPLSFPEGPGLASVAGGEDHFGCLDHCGDPGCPRRGPGRGPPPHLLTTPGPDTRSAHATSNHGFATALVTALVIRQVMCDRSPPADVRLVA